VKKEKQSVEGLDHPFQALGVLLKGRHLPRHRETEKPDPTPIPSHIDLAYEDRLFRDAMADVTPLFRHSAARPTSANLSNGCRSSSSEPEVLARLSALVKRGKGFVVSQTPEYMSGTGPAAAPDVARRLHSGQFSIQACIDLHGYTAQEAKEAFDRFMEETTRLGRRTVLVIHGRGLSSPRRPVLKRQVRNWLSSGRWRKWVMAYCSARLCDGGAGATYVLLHSRPLTKKQRKKRKCRL